MSNMPSSSENLKDLLLLCAAPMAGVSSPIFRKLCGDAGATLTFTEMISAKGLLLRNVRTWEYLKIRQGEQPVGAQLFGTSPTEMAEAGKIVEDSGFALVDVNMGCPVRKVVSTGAGCALMRSIDKAARIIEAIRARVSIPVTAKIRSGWDEEHKNLVPLAKALEAAGLSALAVHPRTRAQGYSGKADWTLIARVREQVGIPVVGNGDVISAETALEMRATTGCHGIMIGRAAMGNPWIFRRVRDALENRLGQKSPSPRERWAAFLFHFRGLSQDSSQSSAFRKMKQIGSWYIRGCRDACRARKALHLSQNGREIRRIVKKSLIS